MNIYTWSGFTKRKNSTMHPPLLPLNPVAVTLKEGTSIENPIFLLSGNNFDIDYIKAFQYLFEFLHSLYRKFIFHS